MSQRFFAMRKLAPRALAVTCCALLGSYVTQIGKASVFHAVTVAEASKTLGTLLPDETRVLEYEFMNAAPYAVTVIGATSSCGCSGLPDLPLVLHARSTSTLRVSVHAPSTRGPIAGKIVLRTDSTAQPLIDVRFAASVADKPSTDTRP